MIDKEQLRLWWNTFVGEGNFTEVRILGRFSYSGYFRNFENLISRIEPYTNMDDEQIYFILNSIDKDCYARPQCEKFVKSPKVTTTDSDIIRRKFLLLDFDPIRKSQTNSSDAQFELAHKKAQDVFRFLREKGWSEPIICVSGNGWHILVSVDLPCNKETDKIIKDFYTYMGSVFTDDKVEFDEKVYTNARLTKLYSTWAKKGANVPSNPWRQSKIVYIPKDLKPTPIEKIKELADLVPKEEQKQAPNRPNRQYNNAPFDLRTWLSEHNIVYKEENQGNSTKFVLQHCPWSDSHSSKKEWESALFQNADGQITFSCFHSHCKDKTWQDFRVFYEPDAYDKPQWQPQVYMPRQPITPQKPKYEIKDEIPELGEKWLSLSSISKLDLTKLEKVKTGYYELDKRIGGLHMTEVTILSGSNSSGKSSWINSLLLNILEQGYKVALWSGELRADILKTWIQMPAAGAHNLLPSKYEEGRYYVPDNVGARIDEWFDGKFYLYNNEYGTQIEQILHDMDILLKVGVKVFILDNLMSMNINLLEGDKNDKQKNAILQIKDFAMTNQVHILLVAHPRKAMAFLRKTDISGTSDISNAVDNVFIMHRVNDDFIHAVTDFYGAAKVQPLLQFGNVLSVEKNRMYGVVDYMCGFHYDIISRRFKNTPDEEIHYSWERKPEQTTMQFAPQTTQAQITIPEKIEFGMPFGAPIEGEAPF